MKRSAMMLAAALGWAAAGITGAAYAEKPDRWVRYVEATGSQYVDTGVRARYGTKAEMKVEWMAFADTSFLAARGASGGNDRVYFCHCGADNAEMLSGFGIWAYIANQGWRGRYESNRIYTIVNEFTSPDENNMVTNLVTVDGLNMTFINGSSAAVSAVRESVDAGCNLYLFACNKGGTATANSKTRCYGVKIWQDGHLVRNFQPCMKNGKAALYDAQNDTFYFGSGGDLVCDANSEEPDEFIEYAEATGITCVDTGIIGRSGTKAECDAAILHSTDASLLDARLGDNRYYLIHAYYGTVTCGYGLHKTTDASFEIGKRYYIESSLSRGSQILKLAADGTTNTIYSASDDTAIDTGLPLYIFGCNLNGVRDYRNRYRLYGLKLWQGDEYGQGMQIVRDFRPCLKKGVVGLYDDVSKRIFYPNEGGILTCPLRRTAVKASNVLFVDYIEADGNNTLDTGVRARAGTRAKGDVSWVEVRTKDYEEKRYLEGPVNRIERTYLGADDPTSWPHYFYMLHVAQGKIWPAYGNNKNQYSAGYAKIGSAEVTIVAGRKYSFDTSFVNGSQTLTLDGTNVWSMSLNFSFDAGCNLHLFSSGSRYGSAGARCYGLEIWQDGVQVRDFKPCVYEGKGMLYDMVTKCVYRPLHDIPLSKVGTIVLTGHEKPTQYVEYVESDGTIFVDTGVRGRSGTAADLKMAFLHAADSSFLDTRNENQNDYYRRFYLWHNYTKESSNNMGFGYGAWNQLAGTFAANTTYHVQSSLSVGRQSVVVDGVSYSNTSGDMANTREIDTELDLYIFCCNHTGVPDYFSKSRLYWVKIDQGNKDGSDMQPMRDFKPVWFSGMVVLWDFVENKPYLPQSVTAPYNYTTFSAVGPDGERIYTGTRVIIR